MIQISGLHNVVTFCDQKLQVGLEPISTFNSDHSAALAYEQRTR